MISSRSKTGRNNVIGLTIARRRKELHISQRELADRLNTIGLAIDKNAVQRLESGQRFVTDLEMLYLAQVFDVTLNDLYADSKGETDVPIKKK